MVGIKVVPQHVAGSKLRAEHTVLFVNHQVPSVRNSVRTEFVVASPELQYANEEEFFAKAPFTAGDKYVYSTVTEHTGLAGR
jgi:hypothetical protein